MARRDPFANGPGGTARIAEPPAEPLRARGTLERFFSEGLGLLAIVDSRFRFVRLTAAWGVVLGRAVEELIGASALDYVHPDHREAALAVAADVLSGKDLDEPLELRAVAADGSTRWLRLTAALGDRRASSTRSPPT